MYDTPAGGYNLHENPDPDFDVEDAIKVVREKCQEILHEADRQGIFHLWARRAYPEPYGKCEGATKDALEEFPDWGLKRVRGHYHCPVWGEREHWWLTDPDGNTFDPTFTQFPSRGSGHYEEWDGSRAEPVNICMDCGEYVYEPRNTFCSDECERKTMEYLNDPGYL